MTYYNYLKNYLEELTEIELLYVWNEYEYEQVYENEDDFFEYNFTLGSEIARSIYYGDYRYLDKYVKFNAYGNLESTDFLDEFIDVDDLIICMMDANKLKDTYEKEELAYS